MNNVQAVWGVIWKIFFLVIFGWILFLARDVVAAFFLAVVISTAFHPAVTYLEKKRLPRIIGTILIYLIALFIVGLIVYAFVPVALSELSNLLSYASKYISSVPGIAETRNIITALNESLTRLTDMLFSGNISLIDIASRLLGGLFFVAAIFVLSFYLTLGREGVEKFLIAILPSAYEEIAVRLYGRVSRKIGKWLTGQLFISLVIGLATFIGLWLLGVRYSFLLGLLAGVLELIPYVGPIFVGSLSVLIGLGDSFTLGAYTFVFFVALQQLENHLLVPVVTRYTTALNPIVVLMSLLIGGKAFGIIGVILAVPAAVTFQEILSDWAEVKQSRKSMGL